MKIIPAATTVALTPEERQVLEALAGSRKAEARMRERARIVLLASVGMASRAIAREVGCTLLPATAVALIGYGARGLWAPQTTL
jgi:hypothetical protein